MGFTYATSLATGIQGPSSKTTVSQVDYLSPVSEPTHCILSLVFLVYGMFSEKDSSKN